MAAAKLVGKTYEQVMLELQKKQYSPIYFLVGKEPYYIDKVADYIATNVQDETEKSFDQHVLYGRDFPEVGPIITMARQFPMCSPYNVIIVREAQAIKKWENFEKYWQNPVQQTILVLCYKAESYDKRLKAFKDLDKTSFVMTSPQLRDYQINKWILDYIRELNANAQRHQQVTIDPQVVQILADSLGTDLSRIAMELKKLLDGCPPDVTKIDAAMVERNIGISKDFNVFELQEALVKGDVVKANRIVDYFAANPKEHSIIKELALLFRFFSNLMIYLYLQDKSDRVAAPILGVAPYAVKDYAAAARRYSKGKTFNIIGYIRQADAKSKGIDTPAISEVDIWKELIYKILH